MIKFLSKNWKRIIYVVTVVIVVFNLAQSIMTPNRIINDYNEFGPDYVPIVKQQDATNVGEKIDDTAGEISDGLTETIMDKMEMSPELAKGLVMFTGLLLIIMIGSNLLESKSAPAKKK